MHSFSARVDRVLRPVFWLGTAATVALWVAACSSSSSAGGTPDGEVVGDDDISSDDDYPHGDSGAKDAQADVVCEYAQPHNDPACPSSYSHSYNGQPCSPVGLSCMYPGSGDADQNGCFYTAALECQGDGGPGDLDAALPDGGDGGREGTWVAAQ
ncbi:MAG TPA: hypothetical protein VF407_07080 [Polyangiaceae bacterium]